MAAMLIGAGVNIVLNPLLIYIFHMGITGAAVATVFSQTVAAIIYIVYLCSGNSLFCFSLKNIRKKCGIFWEIFKVGIPNLIFELLTSLAM